MNAQNIEAYNYNFIINGIAIEQNNENNQTIFSPNFISRLNRGFTFTIQVTVFQF